MLRHATPTPIGSSELADLTTVTLGNGVRVFVIALPGLETANVSVFVRTGSRNESRRLNGISHVVEHMAFKGTTGRTCQQINLDAERLGADVNAHTDKDHTAYHMRGLARDAENFVRMLADIVQHSIFPEAELERERNVILQELAEDEDDPLTIADKLFDTLCFGRHPLGQAVIGSRANIRRFTRDDLLGYIEQQYTGANVVVGIAGNVDVDRILAAASSAFSALRAGSINAVATPEYQGGVATRAQPGCAQTHVLFGYPLPSLAGNYVPGLVAAALFGEGMSSPLMDQIRERRGLVYHASCAAEVSDVSGQFVIEASTSPADLDDFFREVTQLLAAQATKVAAVDFERAKNQLSVRSVRAHEHPSRRLEDAALDLLVHGRVRSREEQMARIGEVTITHVRETFERMLGLRPAAAIAGRVRQGASERVARLLTSAPAS